MPDVSKGLKELILKFIKGDKEVSQVEVLKKIKEEAPHLTDVCTDPTALVCNEKIKGILKVFEGVSLKRCNGTNWVDFNPEHCVLKRLPLELKTQVLGCRKGRGAGPTKLVIENLPLKEGKNKFYIGGWASVRKHSKCGPFYHSFDITCNEDGTFNKSNIVIRGSIRIGVKPRYGIFLKDLSTFGGGHHTLKLYEIVPLK